MSSRYTRVPTLAPLLEAQITGLAGLFPELAEVGTVLLSGSCARGEATYRSDIDLLVVLREGYPLSFGAVRALRDRIEEAYRSVGRADLLEAPLPVQITVVRPTVFATEEPAMREALKSAIDLRGKAA